MERWFAIRVGRDTVERRRSSMSGEGGRRRLDRADEEIPEDQDRPPRQAIRHRGCAKRCETHEPVVRLNVTLTRHPFFFASVRASSVASDRETQFWEENASDASLESPSCLTTSSVSRFRKRYSSCVSLSTIGLMKAVFESSNRFVTSYRRRPRAVVGTSDGVCHFNGEGEVRDPEDSPERGLIEAVAA